MATLMARATGRRKRSVAQVRLYDGTGTFSLNGKPLEAYFPIQAQQLRIMEPFRTVNLEGRYDVLAKLHGGGTTGQSDALRLAISRALVELDPDYRIPLKREGLLTRDSRKVERKKYGLRKARRAPQYTKR